MAYEHISVDWNNPTDADLAAFELIMLERSKKLIHRAANYRATAFYSLYAQKHLGWSRDAAESFRYRIWKDSDYPVWPAFIARQEARLHEA